MSKYDILFFDIDGTLVRDDHFTLSPRTRDALLAAREAGVKLAVASGRCLHILPEEVMALVEKGALSAGHARVLAGMEDDAAKLALARDTVEKGYSVRQLEALAASRKLEPKKPVPARRALPAELSELATRLLSQQFDQEMIRFTKVKSVTFCSEKPVAWTLDGEDGGIREEVTIQCLPSAVAFVMPGKE